MTDKSAITFVDVETTGLSHEDRVVSIGVVHFPDERMMEAGDYDVSTTHLIFNPGRPSHPRARKVHGYSDAELGMQDAFTDHADDLRKYFEHPGLVVAHNASFDRRFVANEFSAARLKSGQREYFCTMLAHRRRYGAKSGLDAVLLQMGSTLREGSHGALQDAWHAMEIYAWLNGWRALQRPAQLATRPLNYRHEAAVPTRAPAIVAAASPDTATTTRSPEFQAAHRMLKPLASVMMSIARADGNFSRDEVDVMSIFIDTRIETLSLDLSGDDYLDLLDDLCGPPPDLISFTSRVQP